MKKILTLILLFLLLNSFNLFAQQYYYTFSELKGMEDNNNDTHLFYRLFTYQHRGPVLDDYTENSIYHLNLENNKDSLFLYSGGTIGFNNNIIVDLDFWNNDPSEYIILGSYCGVDCDTYIRRFDEESSFLIFGIGIGTNIGISKQNDSLVFALNLKSTDGGRNWAVFDSSYRGFISINPYSDDIFSGNYNNIYKSTDGGLTFSKVDTFFNYYSTKFFYDKDSIHIYNLLNNSLRISDAEGDAFSWTERYSSSNPIYVSVDYSQSGSIYLADWKYIYHSTDYGLTFNEYKVLDRKIVGIYKKPDSDKLYAATTYDLYQITPDTIATLKHLNPDPDVFSWFPLEVGNKWVYNSRFTSESEIDEHILVNRVTRQFRYNNNTYFDINGEYGLCYRIDSTSGKIYRAYFEDDTLDYEELFLDLTPEIGDTIYVVQFGGSYPILLANEEGFNDWNLNSRKRNYLGQSTPLYDLSLVKNIGLYYQLVWELVGNESELKGAVIDGKVYGDTTVVGVNDPDNAIKEFSLSQNYPNPFNPSTKIKFVIPKSSLVNLRVYDVLGREVATLVNEEKLPGEYEVEFSAKGGSASDGNEHNLSSGIYFYKLQAGNHASTKKMIYLK
jgi:hypothetical protein